MMLCNNTFIFFALGDCCRLGFVLWELNPTKEEKAPSRFRAPGKFGLVEGGRGEQAAAAVAAAAVANQEVAS